MGTVQKIIEALNRISDDKKGQLTTRYGEHSSWMTSELNLIRSLIRKSPRDDHNANDENVPPVEVNVVKSSSTRISTEKSQDENAQRLKRKSPEMGMLGSSPDLKRNSTQDYEVLATSAGLPTDLNRLKKEHLLEELESRGNTEFSMKSLKKDLVDALKESLLRCSKEANGEESQELNKSYKDAVAVTAMSFDNKAPITEVEVEVDASAVILEDDSSVKSGGVQKARISLMADFRNLVNNPAQLAESESDRAAKIQNEYQARQQRHRQSQIRKLSITDPLSMTSESIASLGSEISGTKESEGKEITWHEAPSYSDAEREKEAVSSVLRDDTANMDLVLSPAKPSAPVSTPVTANGGDMHILCPFPASPSAVMLMDIGSPAPAAPATVAPAPVAIAASSAIPNATSGDCVPVSLCTAAGAAALGLLSEGVPARDRERESMSSIGSYSTVNSSLSLAFNTAGASNLSSAQLSKMQMNNHSVSAVASVTGSSQAAAVKKPSNLMTTHTTFIDKPAPEKAAVKSVIVPALERAKQAKLAEEAKSIQKKRDLEKKIATLNANSTAASAKLNFNATATTSGAMQSKQQALGQGQGQGQGQGASHNSSKPMLSSTIPGLVRSIPLSKSQPLPSNLGSSSGSGSSATPSETAVNPFAGTSNSSVKGKEPTDSSADKQGALAFMSTKKTPNSAVVLSTPGAPSSASATASASEVAVAPAVDAAASGEQEAVSGKSTRRRTIEAPVTLPVPATASATSTAPQYNYSDTTHSSSSAASVPLTTPAPAVAVSAPTATAPMAPITPAAQEQRTAETTQSQTQAQTSPKHLSPASKIPFQAVSPPRAGSGAIPVTPMSACPDSYSKAAQQNRDVAIIEEEGEEVAEEEEENQYEMNKEEDSSDGEGGDDSGTDDDADEDEEEKKKWVPEWAKGPLLKEALERQYGLNGHTAMDPDSIFHEVQTCSLEEIFGVKEGKSGVYAKRTSSAAWDHDSLSLIERRNYRSQMGYGGVASSAVKR